MRNFFAAAYLVATLSAIVVMSGAACMADDVGSDQPEVSGVKQGNVGCAVLEKHTPIKGKLLAVGVIYARTEYRVLDTFNCKLPKEKYTGPGEVNDLNHLAVQDKIKLVIIPSHYTDEQLQQARSICQQPRGSTTPAGGAPAPPPDKSPSR